MSKDWDPFEEDRAIKRALMSIKQRDGLDKFIAEKKTKVAGVMNRFMTRCQVCDVDSGKTKIWHLERGYLCGKHLPEGVTPASLMQEQEAQKEHLKTEDEKPKPDNYGDWA